MSKNTLIEEHFVPIDGYPNYEVSNYGRVINVKRGTDLSPKIDGAGFCNVALYHNGVRRDVGVHRLVAAAFFADFSEDREVKHVNKNRQENTVRNITLGPPLRIAVRIIETGEEFDSLTACAARLGGTAWSVSAVLNENDRHKSYMGYTFEVIEK